jgi:hypothetical protein
MQGLADAQEGPDGGGSVVLETRQGRLLKYQTPPALAQSLFCVDWTTKAAQ